jgi:hypothetical protein
VYSTEEIEERKYAFRPFGVKVSALGRGQEMALAGEEGIKLNAGLLEASK